MISILTECTNTMIPSFGDGNGVNKKTIIQQKFSFVLISRTETFVRWLAYK